MKRRILSILLALVMLIGIIPMSAISASAKAVDDLAETGFSPDNFKAQIKKVSIGAPITGSDGKKYLPVDVHFFAAENLSDSQVVHFLEGYMKAQLKGGELAESIKGLGMTLIGPLKTDAPLESNMWNWDWTPYDTGGGQGIIKYNVPLLENDETQTVEKSQATGMTEANGVKVGDKLTIQNETFVNTSGFPEDLVKELFPDGPSVFSDPFTVVIEEESKYPKEITVSQVDDKTVAPPAEVVLPYTGQSQACPYHDTEGYYVTLNNPETDAGIYTAVLLLRDGYKWTDGSTEGKPAIWAIDKAAITSVTLQHTELTYNTEEQQPGIASVMADSLTVPADGYTVSYSETPLYAGKYTLTVKGKGNFTGSASAEFEIFTVTSDTCNHVDYLWRYEDNKDGKTHKVFCTNCGGCLNISEAHQIAYGPVYINDEPSGVYNPHCIHCTYEGNSVFCKHTDELEYTNIGLGAHKVTCKRCEKVVTASEPHTLVTTPITSNLGGYDLYNGQYTISCEKCDYSAEFTCDHKGTDRVDYVPDKSVYPNFTHVPHCAKCLKLLLDEPEKCVSDGNYTPENINYHASHCTVCGQKASELHNCTGTRKITAIGKTPYKGGQFNLFTRYVYHIYYTETCKDCGALRMGDFNYWDMPVERWLNYDDAFKEIMSMNPDELVNMADTSQFLHTGKYLMLIPATLLSSIYEATGTNTGNCCTLNMNIILSYKGDSADQNGSCALYDKDGKLIQSYRTNKDPIAPSGSDGLAPTGSGDEEEDVLEGDLGKVDFTNDDGACVAVSTDVLMTLPDGENSFTAFFTTGDGQQVAMTMLFTIYTTDDGQKGIKDLHPAGTMINADGDVVSMNLSKDTLIYTGEALELPAVTLTSEMGVEYAEDEDYTLTYYQVVDGVDGEPTEVEIDREQITEIGTYNVVANPTRNGVLSDSSWAQFVVIDEADCPHDWETLSDEDGHWQHCTICGASTRIQWHEDGDKTCEINRVWTPIDGGEDSNVLFVRVYSECPTCGYHSVTKAYHYNYTYPEQNYALATLRNAEINKSGNAIHMKGDVEKDDQVFWDDVLLTKPTEIIGGKMADYNKDEGSIILTFTDDFLATVKDGDHELTICNGDEFTVMIVTVEDHKLIELSDKALTDYDEMDYVDCYSLISDYNERDIPIVYGDLDSALPILGDVDGDGEVTVADATLIQRYDVGMQVPITDGRMLLCGDVDGDGEANIIDVTWIQRHLVNLKAPEGIGKPIAYEFDA